MRPLAVALTVGLALVAVGASVLLAPRGPATQVVELEPLSEPASETAAEPAPGTATEPLPETSPSPLQAPSVEEQDAAASEPLPADPDPVVVEEPAVEGALPAEPAAPAAVPAEPLGGAPQPGAALVGPEVERLPEAVSSPAEPPASSVPPAAAPPEAAEPPAAPAGSEPLVGEPASAGPAALPLRRDAAGVAVQAGAFRSRDFADQRVVLLRENGFPATVEVAGELFRVFAGPFADEAAARAAAERVAELLR